MQTNELVKGDRVKLRNGWEATIEDNNKRGTTRLATVYGLFTEMGSVYAHDIMFKINSPTSLIRIEHTPKQKQLRQQVKAMGF